MTRHLRSVPIDRYQSVAIKWSARGFCQLRDGRPVGLVRIVTGPAVGRVRCPHCQPEDGHEPIPLVILPTRTDIPRGAA